MKRATSPLRNFLLLGLTAALLSAVPAQAWWNGDWTSRKKITVDTGATGVPITGDIGTAPVLVRLHDGNFPFTATKSDGSDLRFIAADDKTPLAFHIEKFDSLLNEAFVWVKVPDLKPGAQTTFWLYYGNGGATATRIDDVKGTYDNDTVLVYHFTERGQPANDASGKNNNARNAGLTVDGAMIGLGLKLDEKNVVTVPASPSLAWIDGAAVTWSAWIKFGASQANAVIFSRLEAGRSLQIGVDRGSPFVEVVADSGKFRSPAGAPMATTGWKHLALTATSTTFTLFLDGEPYATMAAAVPALNGPANFGGDGPTAFVGEIDEMEISNTTRSAGFVKFAALEQGGEKTAKLIVVGEEEQPKNWLAFLKTGYVGIIIGSLTVDGWIVIGLLGVMGIVSWAVMVGKAFYLGRVSKGNELFLELWRKVATDLSVLDAEDGVDGLVDGAHGDGGATRATRMRVEHHGVAGGDHRDDVAADGGHGVRDRRDGADDAEGGVFFESDAVVA